MTDYKPEELLIYTLANELRSSRHVAVGALSPIPAAAAQLAQHSNPGLTISLLGSERYSPFTDGGKELFDCAAQGRIDTFFLSGLQIDGNANINLVGKGPYPDLEKRIAGSFGSAYLYDLVPRVCLFCWNHSPSTLVERVDFVSAAGPGNTERYRPGGPSLLITDKALFTYRSDNRQFELISIHPGQTLESIRENTGFSYHYADNIPATQKPSPALLTLLRSSIADQLSSTYPEFTARIWAT